MRRAHPTLERFARAIAGIARDLRQNPGEFNNAADMLITTLDNMAHDLEAIVRDQCPRCGGTGYENPRRGRQHRSLCECECIAERRKS